MRFGQWKNTGIEGEKLSPRAALAARVEGIKKVSLAIALLVLLGLPSLSGAATYYVSPNGNDANSGTSDAQAWKTIAKVNSFKFAAGDDIYFKCGGTWSGTALQLNVQGASDSNRTVIGAYYGSGTIGVSGVKPIIDGLPSGTGDAKFGTVPTKGNYDGLINALNKSYVTVENLNVQWSGGTGINFSGGNNNIVRNCTVFSSYWGGIRFIGNTGYNIAEYNTVYDTSRVRLDGQEILGTGSIIIVGGGTSSTAHNSIIRYNYLYDNRGEGIDIIKGTYNNIVEYNIVISSKSYNIYFDRRSRYNTARYNLVYGYSGSPWPSSAGIAIQDEKWEKYGGAEGNKIYGNLVAHCSYGIIFDAQHEESVLKDTEIYNNTLVDNGVGLKNWDGPYENSFVKNNIVWCTGARSSCVLAEVPVTHSGLTFDYNLWSSQPTPSVRGKNDPSYAAPLLAKKTGWNTISRGSLTGKEFALDAGSPAIGTGTPLGAPFNSLLNPAPLDFCKNDFQLADQNAHGAWEIGATVFGTSTAVRPPSRLNLVVTP